MLFQTNVVLAIASDPDNPITSAITSAIDNITNPSPTPTPSPSPSPSPSSNPISLPITNPSPSPSATPSPTPSPSPTPTPVTAVINSISPNPATQGTLITITGSGFSNSSKVFISQALMPTQSYTVSEDGKTLTFSLTTEVNFEVDKTYSAKAQNGNLDSNQVNITIAPSIIQDIPSVTASQFLIAPSVILSQSKPEVVMASSNFNTNITIPSSVTNPVLNFSNVLSTFSTYTTAIYNNIINVDTTTSMGNIKLEIPALTTISGPLNWDGKMNAPKLLSNTSATPVANSGKSATTQAVLEVGLGDTVLTFDKAVRLLVTGQAGKLVGFQRGSTFSKITQSCEADSHTTGDNLPSNGDCYISVGSDLVIWTKHFTKFVTYTETSSTSSTSNSNNGSGASSNSNSVCVDSKPQSAPKLLSAKVSGRNQVTLTWSKAQDPVNYYLVAYGTKSGKLEYGNPNIGGKDTTSYVVKGLNNNQTYYFKIRAGNNCMPGEFSNELSSKSTGDNLSGPAKGFKAGILSAQSSTDSAVDLKFKPITQAYPQRIVIEAKSVFGKIASFITNLFGSK